MAETVSGHNDLLLTLHKFESDPGLPQFWGREDLGTNGVKGQALNFALQFWGKTTKSHGTYVCLAYNQCIIKRPVSIQNY